MIDIIILIFAAIHIGKIATRKGLKPGLWRFYTVIAWLAAEFAGIIIGVMFFGIDNLMPTILLAIGAAAGSYFILKANLENRPDNTIEEDINRIRVSDLYPTKNPNSSSPPQ